MDREESGQEHLDRVNRLIERSTEGDNQAFDELFKEYEKKVLYVCQKFLKEECGHDNIDDAEDICIEAWGKASKYIHKYEYRAAFDTWVCEIAKQECRYWFSKRKSKNVLLPEHEEKLGEPSHSEPVLSELELDEIDARIYAELNESDGLIYGLRIRSGWKFAEIADKLGMKIKNVEARYYRKIQPIVERIGKEYL